MLPNLSELRKFKHPGVIQRFKKEFPNQATEADSRFEDLMIFFWASKQHEILKTNSPNNPEFDFVFIMDEDMKPIDHMWHIFLLYTQDYQSFCEENFGEFLHHLPDVIPNGNLKTIAFEENLRRFLEFVQSYLGEDIVQRWFAPTIEKSNHLAEIA